MRLLNLGEGVLDAIGDGLAGTLATKSRTWNFFTGQRKRWAI